MAAPADPLPAARPGWIARLASDPGFQRRAARWPLIRRLVRREGEAMFDLLAGFCHTQVLTALVELGVLEALSDGPRPVAALARASGVPEDRLTVLLRAGAALGLLSLRRGAVRLTRRGAALTGVPGLTAMIRHNAVLYGDLSDPAAFFRGGTDPDMARFWPYVFGAGAAEDPAAARRYSRLMEDTQTLVAEEVLGVVDLGRARRLLDVGGGTGAFLRAVADRYPGLELSLFDLPQVIDVARPRMAGAVLHAGSFRDDPLPRGADTISLIRVLFDHDDATVADLLSRVRAALPLGGRLVIAEPMGREAAPSRPADAYYALYTLAMGTGRTRTAEAITELCRGAGFVQVTAPRTARPFIASVVTAQVPT